MTKPLCCRLWDMRVHVPNGRRDAAPCPIWPPWLLRLPPGCGRGAWGCLLAAGGGEGRGGNQQNGDPDSLFREKEKPGLQVALSSGEGRGQG